MLIARRAKKHLDELEVIALQDTTESKTGTDYFSMQRSNYTEVDIGPDQADGTAEGSGRRGRGAARQALISDKRPSVHPNKKSTMNIRTALLYKKNLATLIEESVRRAYTVSRMNGADFLLEGRREPTLIRTELSFRRRSTPKGTPASALLHLRVLGQVQVHEMRSTLL